MPVRPAARAQKIASLVIIGAGGHAVSAANVALSAGYRITCFVDRAKAGSSLLGAKIIGDLANLEKELHEHLFCIAVGDNAAREFVLASLTKSYPHLRFPCLVHRSAVVSSFVTIGDGTIVMPNAVIGPNSQIGGFCIVNTRASIDHDSTMADFSSLAPAVATGGTVHVGERSAISIGAIIRHGITIGPDSVVGANSYVNKDVAANKVVYGTPAREVRSRERGDKYLA